MTDTYVQQRVHLVRSTRNRQDFLHLEIRDRLYAYTGGIIRHCQGTLFAAGGTSDHIHLYCEYPKTIALAQFVNKIKSNSSRWLRETFPELRGFHWQSGYGAFSVDRRGDARLMAYIRNQESHHRRVTSQVEYGKLLSAYRFDHDAKHISTG